MFRSEKSGNLGANFFSEDDIYHVIAIFYQAISYKNVR